MPTADFLLALGAFFFLALITWARLPIIVAFILTLVGCFLLGFLIKDFFLRPLIGEKSYFCKLCLLWDCRQCSKDFILRSGAVICIPIRSSFRRRGAEIRFHLYCPGIFSHADYQRYFSCSIRPVFQKISPGYLYALCRR